MLERVLVTAVGEDRPGLAAALSGFVARNGCNIEDSRMAILGSEFAMLLLVAGAPPAILTLLQGLGEASEAMGLLVTSRFTRPRPPAGALPFELTATCMDHPGIVQGLTELLAERRVNVRALETRSAPAAHTGQPLFSLRATLEVPAALAMGELRRALDALGESEGMEVRLEPSAAGAEGERASEAQRG